MTTDNDFPRTQHLNLAGVKNATRIEELFQIPGQLASDGRKDYVLAHHAGPAVFLKYSDHPPVAHRDATKLLRSGSAMRFPPPGTLSRQDPMYHLKGGWGTWAWTEREGIVTLVLYLFGTEWTR